MAEENGSATNGFLLGIIVIILVGIVGYLAYTSGFGQGQQAAEPDINISLPDGLMPDGGSGE
ncbi:hypothetical protein GW756_00655 [bacterium]|nr:hypothetical protein [bacterium]NCQ54869.1 hypothetical protein [Candidatus Parcubacteria bacterium]NCS66913.1 hypothetical protein [Candidatus Peregrinibacteria bacterium]NCS95859.1 hypothetical protein [bacterium]